MRDVTCEVLVATDVAQRGLDIKNAGSSVACCDNMCSQAELANVGPHSKVQFVVNYDAPANMEERCGNIGWHIDLFGLTSDIFHVNVLYTVILHFGVLGTICHRIFFELNNSHFSRTMCTESAVQAAQVKKAWSLPLPTVPWQSWQWCRAGDAYTCLYESENASLGATRANSSIR